MKKHLMIGAAALGLVAATASGVMIGRASADQPHMYNALDALRHARAELEMAVPDKGGHRVFAIEATERAIRETRAGIDYAR
jgi:predicted outer membrane protein